MQPLLDRMRITVLLTFTQNLPSTNFMATQVSHKTSGPHNVCGLSAAV